MLHAPQVCRQEGEGVLAVSAAASEGQVSGGSRQSALGPELGTVV